MVPHPRPILRRSERQRDQVGSGTEREERKQISFNPAKDSYSTSSQEKAVFSNHYSSDLKTPERNSPGPLSHVSGLCPAGVSSSDLVNQVLLIH